MRHEVQRCADGDNAQTVNGDDKYDKHVDGFFHNATHSLLLTGRIAGHILDSNDILNENPCENESE